MGFRKVFVPLLSQIMEVYGYLTVQTLTKITIDNQVMDSEKEIPIYCILLIKVNYMYYTIRILERHIYGNKGTNLPKFF